MFLDFLIYFLNTKKKRIISIYFFSYRLAFDGIF